MAIINLSPNSFSDGGEVTAKSAARAVETAAAGGAAWVDVGGMSTAPGNAPISPKDEWDRLAPALPAIIASAHSAKMRVSVDTFRPAVARRAAELGADMINDVSGAPSGDMLSLLQHFPHLRLAYTRARRGPNGEIPAPTRPKKPVQEAISDFVDFLNRAEKAGIEASRVVLDPGCGAFTSGAAQDSFALLAGLPDVARAFPKTDILVGTSRKGFLAPELPPKARDPHSIGSSLAAAAGLGVLANTPKQAPNNAPAAIIRIHNAADFGRAAQGFFASFGTNISQQR